MPIPDPHIVAEWLFISLVAVAAFIVAVWSLVLLLIVDIFKGENNGNKGC